jgi:hypothetical protein
MYMAFPSASTDWASFYNTANIHLQRLAKHVHNIGPHAIGAHDIGYYMRRPAACAGSKRQ